MTAKLSYNENTPKATNTGRPIKGFEQWRTRAMNQELMSKEDFIRDIVQGAVKAGAEVSLWFNNGQKVIPFSCAGKWNLVIAKFQNGQISYRTYESIVSEYNEYKTNFENWQNHLRNC